MTESDTVANKSRLTDVSGFSRYFKREACSQTALKMSVDNQVHVVQSITSLMRSLRRQPINLFVMNWFFYFYRIDDSESATIFSGIMSKYLFLLQFAMKVIEKQ